MRRLIPILGLLLCATPAHAALAEVQACENEGSASGSLTIVATCTTSSGHLLVAVAREGSNNTDTITFSDSGGSTWATPVCGTAGSNGFKACMSYACGANADTTITATFQNSDVRGAIVVYEFSGAATSSCLDGSIVSSNSTVATTSLASGSLTTTNANDVILYGISPNGPGGAATAGTLGGSQMTFGTSCTSACTSTTGAVSTNGRANMDWVIVSSTQSAQTTTTSWATSQAGAIGLIGAWKASAGGAACTPTLTLLGVGRCG
jgi:hypothetical protein